MVVAAATPPEGRARSAPARAAQRVVAAADWREPAVLEAQARAARALVVRLSVVPVRAVPVDLAGQARAVAKGERRPVPAARPAPVPAERPAPLRRCFQARGAIKATAPSRTRCCGRITTIWMSSPLAALST